MPEERRPRHRRGTWRGYASSDRGAADRACAPARPLALGVALAGCGWALNRGQGVAGPSGQQAAVLPQVTRAPAAPAVAPPTARPPPPPCRRPTARPHGDAAPLSIATLRGGDYPGSEIIVDQVLPAGSNYSRQMVSYRSEGLKIQALMTVPRGQRPRPAGRWSSSITASSRPSSTRRRATTSPTSTPSPATATSCSCRTTGGTAARRAAPAGRTARRITWWT